MTTFLDQPGVPLVEAELLPGRRVRLSQKRFHNHGLEHDGVARPWQIPVTLRYRDGSGTRTERVLVTRPDETFELKTDSDVAWLHPNAGERGYYRWRVSPEMLAAIGEQAPEALSLRERVGLVGQVSALLDAGRIGGEDLLRFTEDLSRDPSAEVASALIDVLGKIRHVFVTPELEGAFAVYVGRVLHPYVDRHGLEASDGEEEAVTLLRPRLIGWLGDEGRDDEVLAFARTQANRYLEDPTAVDPALAGVVIGLAAIDGDMKLFDRYREKFEAAETPHERTRFLSSLGDFRDQEVIDEALRYALEGPLRAQELGFVPYTLRSRPSMRPRVFSWVMENYEALTARIPPMYAAFFPHFCGGCSEELLRTGEEFFADPAHSPPGTEKELAEVAESVTHCVGLRQREGEAVAAYLEALSAVAERESR
jgi:aminopeptidase N